MAALTMRQDELEEGWAPDVCARCGRPAVCTRTKTVNWAPGWVLVVVLLSLLIGVIIWLVVHLRFRITLPFCNRHKNHWRWRTWTLVGLFLTVVGLIGGGVAVGSNGSTGEQVRGWMVAVGLLGLVVWVVLAVALSQTAIRLTDVFGSRLTLYGVSTRFASAVEQRRRESREEEFYGEPTDYEERLRARRESARRHRDGR